MTKQKSRTALNHWAAVMEGHAAVLDFIEFLNNKGISLDWSEADEGVSLNIRDLADEFCQVDRQQLEKERRELLTAIQNQG